MCLCLYLQPPCAQFWPDEKNRTIVYGDMEINYNSDKSQNCNGYVLYNIQVTDMKQLQVSTLS